VTKTCIVVGCAAGMMSEYALARLIAPKASVLAVKGAGCVIPEELLAWVTLHPEQYEQDREQREKLGLPVPSAVWSNIVAPGFHYAADKGGSSALLAVFIALEAYAADRIILAGVPLTPTPYFNKLGDLEGVTRYRDAWLRVSRQLGPHVRSMSGWTRELFGYPHHNWIQGEQR
jgi:hypothetical protein